MRSRSRRSRTSRTRRSNRKHSREHSSSRTMRSRSRRSRTSRTRRSGRKHSKRNNRRKHSKRHSREHSSRRSNRTNREHSINRLHNRTITIVDGDGCAGTALDCTNRNSMTKKTIWACDIRSGGRVSPPLHVLNQGGLPPH